MRYDGNGEIEHPISIPSDILESILGKVDSAYESFTSYSKRIKQLQEKSRELLESENKIKNCQDGRAIDFSDIYGVDGTYAIKRSVTADVYVIASILFGNDRLYPKSETFVLPPSDHSTRIAQGVMTILEIECLHPPRNNAVVLYDGSFLTPIIKLNSLYSDYNKNLTDFRFTIRGTPIENIMDDFRQKKTLSDAIQTKRVFAIPKESSA